MNATPIAITSVNSSKPGTPFSFTGPTVAWPSVYGAYTALIVCVASFAPAVNVTFPSPPDIFVVVPSRVTVAPASG